MRKHENFDKWAQEESDRLRDEFRAQRNTVIKIYNPNPVFKGRAGYEDMTRILEEEAKKGSRAPTNLILHLTQRELVLLERQEEEYMSTSRGRIIKLMICKRILESELRNDSPDNVKYHEKYRGDLSRITQEIAQEIGENED